jgi:hypothetical protein
MTGKWFKKLELRLLAEARYFSDFQIGCGSHHTPCLSCTGSDRSMKLITSLHTAPGLIMCGNVCFNSPIYSYVHCTVRRDSFTFTFTAAIYSWLISRSNKLRVRIVCIKTEILFRAFIQFVLCQVHRSFLSVSLTVADTDTNSIYICLTLV